MKHVIVFCYIFTILIGVSALTIQWLAGKGDKGKEYSVMKPFILMLVIMNLYDFFIYYSDKIINHSSGNMILSIGDCLIAVLVLFWLRVETNICQSEDCNWVVRIAKKYILFYFCIWMVSVIFFVDIKWTRLIIDIPLLCLLIAGSIACIVSGLKKGDSHKLIAYKSVITLFMTVNYVTYFISESGIVKESNEDIMDLTIFYWLVINAANIILLYKRDFSKSYLVDAPVAMDINEALDLVKQKYDLTKREVEILKEIYEGKTNTQIAEELFISESTVKAHIYNTFRKMNVKNRVEAVCIVREENDREQ